MAFNETIMNYKVKGYFTVQYIHKKYDFNVFWRQRLAL